LLYLKGGVAFLNVETKSHYEGENFCSRSCGLSTFDFSESETLYGWTIGVGAEYALTSSLSLKLEDQHVGFGDVSSSYSGFDKLPCHDCGSELTGTSETSPTIDAVTVGVNYKFNRGDDGLK
jgi:outer membrane immunogenic protein